LIDGAIRWGAVMVRELSRSSPCESCQQQDCKHAYSFDWVSQNHLCSLMVPHLRYMFKALSMVDAKDIAGSVKTLINNGLGSSGHPAFYPLVDHWQNHDLDRARHQSAYHHDRQRLLDLGASPGRNDKWYQADAADQRA